MTMKSGSLEYWRNYFRAANSDIFDIIDHAIMVAVSDCPKEFRLRRDGIAERLFSCRLNRCVGCDRLELAVSGDDEGDGGCKSGFDRDATELEAGASKESKVHSSRDDHGEMNRNQVGNFSFGEAEALTDEIEEESQMVGEVLRIKEVLHNSKEEPDSVLFESLRRLQLLALTVDLLKGTEIGKAVNPLRKHGSKEIRQLARTLIDGWKEMVDEWVKSTAAIAGSAEGTPDSVDPSVVDEEEGLPSPPMDEGAFLAAPTGPMELSQFFDGMDDDGNFRQSGEFIKTREHIRKLSMDSQNVAKRKPQASSEAKESNCHQMKKNEVAMRQSKPVCTDSGPGRPPRSSLQQKTNAGPKMQQKQEKSAIPKRPLVAQQDKFKCSDDVSVQVKLEATKRKLQESYQQAENAKKQRTIQVMELHDLPKQGNGHRNPHFKPGNLNKHWAHGRR
ncbi:probable mediator of RNA polymerase II transcription subunit 26b [Neltuma alba]|uniref:probable mediator of RNA polymerase II transcription subunit 26b n=1 Tax=Neltuma alba TaxID=207710 RepID=UPI0010A40FF5|nr:probable mediator of RNA polymerase II transcription subunit 26b [Prosopis alba]XP_028779039.1 probable mediator of RNA polymerase II transcription subunit 26b [Prosopis alba]XP_028791134.1 probable mediator of RNA polymerase II transcription subunit 26b [Prosopis alba]